MRIQLCYCNNSNSKYNNGSDINAYYVNNDKTNNAHDIDIGNEKKKTVNITTSTKLREPGFNVTQNADIWMSQK